LSYDCNKLNANGPINRASKHRKQKLVEMKGKIDKFIIAVGDLTPFSVIVK
jgi:hypothetical protein